MIIAEHETNFSHGKIRAFFTSSQHALRSFQRDCVIAIEIAFVQKYGKIPKYYDKIKNFNKKAI